MKRKLMFSTFVAMAHGLVLMATFCTARPHTHGHHHDEYPRHVAYPSSASSASSLILAPSGTICGSKNGLAMVSGLTDASLGNALLPLNLTVHVPIARATSAPFLGKALGELKAVLKPSKSPSGSLSYHRSASPVGYAPSRAPNSAIPDMPSGKSSYTSTGSAIAVLPTDHSGKALVQANSKNLNVSPISGQKSWPAIPRAIAIPRCPADNGTIFQTGNSTTYQVICDVDFPDNDYPFLLVNSYDSCVQACDEFNAEASDTRCVSALFVPSRLLDSDNCYLKSSVKHPTVAKVGIEGAILVTSTTSAFSVSTSTTSKLAVAPLNKTPTVSGPGVTYASGSSIIVPEVADSHLHGPSQNLPTTQYINVTSPPLLTLTNSLLVTGVNGDLSTGYDISLGTGILEVNISTQSYLSPLKNKPHLSRDGGRGGYLNGQHLFLFCDTGSYTTTTSSSSGNFLGFVSSSVAIDVGMSGLTGKPLKLQDGIGEWSDDAGRMRSFAPLTQGEQSYNQVMQGEGQRYAIWPEASIIPLDAETALVYAPIVYDNVNQGTRAAVFTYTGTTLLSITANGKGGPVAERIVPKIFSQDDIEWGCSGGIRSWGPSGIGGMDGKVYVFGNVQGGILLGRTSPGDVAKRDSYEYWDGDSWSSTPPEQSSKAFFISGPFMDVDIFYSPRHLTFIAVYLTIYADSTFYYRYLESDRPVLPPYAPGGNTADDFVANILRFKWSDEKVLYKASPGLSGKYIYAGGVHKGYYGSDDITNGGSRMLLSWTAPTGLDPSSISSEYQLVTAGIDWA